MKLSKFLSESIEASQDLHAYWPNLKLMTDEDKARIKKLKKLLMLETQMYSFAAWIEPSGLIHEFGSYGHREWMEENSMNRAMLVVGDDIEEIYKNHLLPKNGWIRIEGGEWPSLKIEGRADKLNDIEEYIKDMYYRNFTNVTLDLYENEKSIQPRPFHFTIESMLESGIRTAMSRGI